MIARLWHGHQLAQDCQFHLQLHAIHHSFERDLENAEVEVLDHQQTNVQRDNDHIDRKQLPHCPANPFLRDDVQKAEDLSRVDARYDELLNTKCRHLEFLNDLGRTEESLVVRICAEMNNCRHAVEDDGIHHDHPEDEPEDFGILEDNLLCVLYGINIMKNVKRSSSSSMHLILHDFQMQNRL